MLGDSPVKFENLLKSISHLFGAMYQGAPLLWGSRWPMFLVELLALIALIDIVLFGWRPLVRKLFPDAYSTVDYVFGQVVNAGAFLTLVVFTVYLGRQLGNAWGTFLGLSTMVWSVIAFVVLLFLGRLIARRSR